MSTDIHDWASRYPPEPANANVAASAPANTNSTEPPFITVKQALRGLVEISELPVFATPHNTLNGALGFGGFLGGSKYDLAAGTGLGKTSMVGGMANSIAKDCDVIWAFYEAFAAYPLVRTAAGHPDINKTSNELIRDAANYIEAMEKVLSNRILLLDRPSLSTLSNAARYLVQKNGKPPFVVIDYEQKLGDQVQAAQLRPDARLAMSETSDALLRIASDNKSPVLAVSAMSRLNNKRAKDVRKMSPYELVDVAKESGAIEYDSAGLIVLTLSDEYEGDERVGTMTVAKSRFGEGVHADMRFHPSRGTWRDLGRIEKPADDDISELVRESLLVEGAAIGTTELAKRIKRQRSSVFASIKEMIAGGEIQRTDRGLELVS